LGYSLLVIEIRQTAEYESWFETLRDREARFRILARLRRLSLGNFGDIQPVGEARHQTSQGTCQGSVEERAMTSTSTNTRTWDAAEYLKTDEDVAAYLDAALEEEDPALLAAALGDVARAKGMTDIARETGLGRESLYNALSSSGNPEFATVQKVVRSLGLRLHISA
jgi:probable addiction module antidote protein